MKGTILTNPAFLEVDILWPACGNHQNVRIDLAKPSAAERPAKLGAAACKNVEAQKTKMAAPVSFIRL